MSKFDETEFNEKDVALMKSGAPQRIAVPRYEEIRDRMFRLEYGWHDADYLWHFQTHRTLKPGYWVALVDRVFNLSIPKTVKVDLRDPHPEHEIKIYTVRAYGLRDCWQIDAATLDKITKKLLDVLNTLV